MHGRWMKLRYWQKGALIGGGLHILAMVFIMIIFLVGHWLTPEYGKEYVVLRDHLAELLGVVGLVFFSLVGSVPMYILRLLGFESTPPIYTDPRTDFGTWMLYILYATVIYSLAGATVGKMVQVFKNKTNGAVDDSNL